MASRESTTASVTPPETTPAEATIAAERIATTIRAANLGDGALGASFGTAVSSDLDGEGAAGGCRC